MKYRFVGVYQKTDRPSKPWYAVADYYTPEGKRRPKTKTFPEAKGTREAKNLALEWVAELNKQAEEELKVEDTVEEICSKYIEDQKRKHIIEDSTYHWHKQKAQAYLYPYIGSLGFYGLERKDIEDWITKLHSKGYNQHTIRSAFLLLNKVYANAVRTEQIDKNPCSLVTVPSGKPRKSYMTDAQMKDFLAAVWAEYDNPENYHFLLAYLLAYYQALRRGECCALRWRDIDLESGMLTVSSAVSMRDGGMYMKGPKTATSYRQIPLQPEMWEILKKRYEEIQPEINWFVCGIKDWHIGLTQFNVHFKNFVRKYNLRDAYGEYLHPHSLRHNFGYSAVRSGADIGALSRIMGHSNQSITLNVYSDTSPEAVKVGMERISKFFKERDLDE